MEPAQRFARTGKASTRRTEDANEMEARVWLKKGVYVFLSAATTTTMTVVVVGTDNNGKCLA